jgi:hypothetical protein
MKRIMITVSLFMLVLAISSPVFAGTFRDDFEDGNLDEWGEIVNYMGGASEWKIENGELICDRPNGWTCVLLFGKKEWKNYSIECDAKIVKAYSNCQAVGFSFRVNPNGQQNADEVWCSVGRSWCSRLAGWIEVWLDNNAVNASIKDFNFELNRWYHLKGIANGINFEFYVDGELMVSLSDSHFATGYLALENNNVAHYDNVIITGDDVPDNLSAVVSQDKLTTSWGQIKSR